MQIDTALISLLLMTYVVTKHATEVFLQGQKPMFFLIKFCSATFPPIYKDKAPSCYSRAGHRSNL